MEEPFGPPPKEYNYCCSVCGTELLVNEAIIDAGIGMAKLKKEYYEGYMPKAQFHIPNNSNCTPLVEDRMALPLPSFPKASFSFCSYLPLLLSSPSSYI